MPVSSTTSNTTSVASSSMTSSASSGPSSGLTSHAASTLSVVDAISDPAEKNGSGSSGGWNHTTDSEAAQRFSELMTNESAAGDRVGSNYDVLTGRQQGLEFSDLFNRPADPKTPEITTFGQEDMSVSPPGTTLAGISPDDTSFTAAGSWNRLACKPAHPPNPFHRYGSPVNCMALNPDMAESDDVLSKIGDYLHQSLNQVIMGNYTDDATALGTCAQIATGIFDLDLPADIRDLSYDMTHWEWSWGHIGQTVVDAAGLLPVVGVIKYGDEAAAVVKNGAKHIDEGAELTKKLDDIGEVDGLKTLPDKVIKQINKRGLPQSGQTSFVPRLTTNTKGQQIMQTAEVKYGPKAGKKGVVDQEGRIWIKDEAHAGYPEHWDVQIDQGKDYIRVGMDGNPVVRE